MVTRPAGERFDPRLGAALAAALLGMTLTVLAFRPGSMSPDSLDSYAQAQSGVYSDAAQPPMMALAWSAIQGLVPGPLGMLLLHNALFWPGLALVAAARTRRPWACALIVLLVGLAPPVFALLGVLWKDVGMGAALTLSVGILAHARRQGRPRWSWLALPPLFYGFALRLNAAPAVLPLLAAVAWNSGGDGRRRARAAAILTLALFLSFLGLTRVLDAVAVTDRGAGTPGGTALECSLMHDIAGISVRTGTLFFPRYVYATRPPVTLDSVRPLYDPADVNPLMWNPGRTVDNFFVAGPEDFRDLLGAWRRAVTAHPRAYVQHRLAVIGWILQVSGVRYPFSEGIPANTLGLRFEARPLYLALVAGLHRTVPVTFRGFAYLALAIALLAHGLRRRRGEVIGVAASGVFYVLPYAVVSSGADFRYVWWMIVASLLALVLALPPRP